MPPLSNCEQEYGALLLKVEGALIQVRHCWGFFALLTRAPDRNREWEGRLVLAPDFRSISSDCGQ